MEKAQVRREILGKRTYVRVEMDLRQVTRLGADNNLVYIWYLVERERECMARARAWLGLCGTVNSRWYRFVHHAVAAKLSLTPRAFFTDIRLLQQEHLAKPTAPTRYVQALSRAGFSILIRPNLPMTGAVPLVLAGHVYITPA